MMPPKYPLNVESRYFQNDCREFWRLQVAQYEWIRSENPNYSGMNTIMNLTRRAS